MQHIQDNTEQNTSTEQNTRYNNMQHRDTSTENTEQTQYPDTSTTQPQHTCSAHNYRTYSLDYYFEYAVINNSNTIELYTISKENIQF